MKQLLQNLKNGEGFVADVPAPIAQRGRVLVRTAASLVSAGTERAFVELARKNLIAKATERPDLVRRAIESLKTEGLLGTANILRDKLEASHALGYSAAGVVVESGEDVAEFAPGDRVACAGTGYAAHAELLSVPRNLCCRLPQNVDFESGAFATVGAIALQSVRLAEPTLGESVVVIGLGLLGQIVAQLLRANGCRVFGVDLDESKVDLAIRLGADAACLVGGAERQAISDWSRGRGADAVIVTAATSSSEPIELAGEISRPKGRVVALGATGLDIRRQAYYQRELTLRVSMSYGPGRYDPQYEEQGIDYPLPYVRWTEGRNIEAFLDMLASGVVRVSPLVTHRYKIEESSRAYDLLSGPDAGPYLGIIIQYDTESPLQREVVRKQPPGSVSRETSEVRVGLIGAGDYARRVLLPLLQSNKVVFSSVATASGVTAHDVGKKYGFERLASGADEVLSDPGVNLVVIATRHNTHAELACQALARGRNVFVEKPLALTEADLSRVLEAAETSSGSLTVGYNRRFSPLSRMAKDFFSGFGPLSVVYRVNAGAVLPNHWTNDPEEGGGRILGEVCHFVDLVHFLTGSLTERVFAESISSPRRPVSDDSVSITLKLSNGSNAMIAYLAGGDRSLPKERVEITGGSRSFVIDDFRAAESYSGNRQRRTSLRRQDKGQAAQIAALCLGVRSGTLPLIPLNELAAVTRVTFGIRESLRTATPQTVPAVEAP